MKIEDIAKKAGVSKGTVSKVINGYPRISEETRKKVLEIIKDLNYVPNNSAQSLAGKKNKIIGLFVYGAKGIHTSYFFESFVGSVVDNAEKKGFSVLVSIIDSKLQRDKAIKLYESKMIDGSIFIGMNQNQKELDLMVKKNYKIALIDYIGECTQSNVVLVNSNNYNGATKATKYLLDSGCKNLLHVSGDKAKFAGLERLRGYEDTIKNHKINSYIFEGDFNGEQTKEKLRPYFQKLKKIPDGIFFANDEMAIKTIELMKELGIDIDMKIIGFDNIAISEYIEPSLTTISVDTQQIAACAVDCLIEKIENDENENACNYESDIELKVRES